MRLPEYCATHSLKEFMEMLGPDFEKDNTQNLTMSMFLTKDDLEKARAEQKKTWLEKELADNPGHETNMYLTKGNDPLVDRDCAILDGACNCERIQGVLNCKYNTF